MDASPARHPDDDLPFPSEAFDPVPPAGVVRLGDPGELAAALPQLVGFAPRDSLVLVGLGGPGGARVGLTARVDIPPVQHAPALARALAARLDCDGPDAAVILVASDEPDLGGGGDLPHRDLVHEVVLALEPYGIGLREALLVRAGRWWSYDCPHDCCLPGAGTPVPGGTSALAAASVAAGQVVAGSRDELVARLAPAEGAAADRMAGVVVQVGEELAGLVDSEGRDAAAVRYGAWVEAAVRRCVPAGARTRPGDTEVARVVWGLRDVRVRDRALGFALGPLAAAAEALWTECTRRAPAPLDAAPATLLAVCAWLRGDGATARIALDRALDGEPGYALADLLARGLDAGLAPADLRAMVVATQADLSSAAGAVTPGPGAPTAGPARARPGRPAPSRTRRRRSRG
jgi:Domain of unknown function (DUF4192)